VRIFAFGRDSARPTSSHQSVGAAIAGVARIEGRTQIVTLHLEAGGRLGRHPAVVNQLLMVVAGTGWVSGEDGSRTSIGPGRAAFWVAGEEHETGTDTGLIAVVIESAGLDPAALMAPA
jgi:quercetin dioxygenase-like cupin family protein